MAAGGPNSGRRSSAWRWTLLGASLLALSACSSEQHEDLQAYVEEVKVRYKGRVAPLPEVKRYETHAYAADDLRDPFVPIFQLETRQETADPGIRPDMRRKREALEAFSLDSLTLVGQLERAGQSWALIAAPDGTIHRVQVGNHLGLNYGKIIAIHEDRLELNEIVPDGLGGWLERPARLALSE